MEQLNLVLAFLSSNGDSIAMVGSFVWLAVGKFVSTEKAKDSINKGMVVISKFQGLQDAVANGMRIVGAILSKSCEIVAKVIESDGFLGKK